MRVKVHPNRHRVNAGEEACISVTPDRKGGWTHYSGSLVMKDVRFRIHKSGVERARREGQRNVHAWAVGELVEESLAQDIPVPAGYRKVTYFFQEGYFRDHETHEEVTETPVLYAVGRDFYYLPV